MTLDLPRIFVNIASYRDTECQWTLKDMFEKARHPERVFAGLCWQFVPEEDQDCFLFQIRPDQCRIVEIHADHSRGACWARNRAQALWQGEEYVLQIDSHMRFAQNWDETLITMLPTCRSPRAVLSTYPPGYTPPGNLGEATICTILAKEFAASGVLQFGSRTVPAKDAPELPQPTPFIAAGLLFGPAAWAHEVPYDPYIYFQGEEITLAARLWTHGWDIFIPNKPIAWHDYTKRPGRRRHWDDSKTWEQLNVLAYARVRHMLGMEEATDPEATRELDRYGLGTARSLDAYEAFASVSFRDRLIDGMTAEQRLANLSPAEKSARCRDKFAEIYREGGWGTTETRSGDGATLARTEVLRPELERLFDLLDIRILADAGCGELNWMNKIAGRLRVYMGYDIVPDIVDAVRQRWGGYKNWAFNTMDICTEITVEADAILCRDCLTHLPTPMVLAALGRFKASRSRYLIATTFATGRNTDIKAGDWQAIDLTAPPFSLPAPRLMISENAGGGGKSLGVWLTSDLPS